MNFQSSPPIALATLSDHPNEQEAPLENVAQPCQPHASPALASEQLDNGPNQYYSPAPAPGYSNALNHSTGSADQISLGTKDGEPWI